MIKDGSTYRQDKPKGTVEIGDSKQEEFYPQIKSIHGESHFSIRLSESIENSTYSKYNDVITWSKDDIKARFYNKDEDFESGGFEFEVEFASRPKSNTVNFTFQSKDLEFIKQYDLTEKEKAETVKLKNGKTVKKYNRPENVINSYVIKKDGKKIAHIPRLYLKDANNKQAWCDQTIDPETGLYSVDMPPDFLDNAAYPVILDPTIGYTTIGGSTATYGGSGEEYICVKFTSIEAGNTIDIETYTKVTYAGSSQPCAWAIFSHDSVNNRPNAQLVKVTGTYDTTLAWYNQSITYAFANGETLWLCFWPSTHADLYYDSGGTDQTWRKYANVTYSTFETPFTTSDSTSSNEVYSIKMNYTASGGGTNSNFLALM